MVNFVDIIVQMDVFIGIHMIRTVMDDSIAAIMEVIIILVNVRDVCPINDKIVIFHIIIN
jgi:hypothetical protein